MKGVRSAQYRSGVLAIGPNCISVLEPFRIFSGSKRPAGSHTRKQQLGRTLKTIFTIFHNRAIKIVYCGVFFRGFNEIFDSKG